MNVIIRSKPSTTSLIQCTTYNILGEGVSSHGSGKESGLIVQNRPLHVRYMGITRGLITFKDMARTFLSKDHSTSSA